jgi:rhodanese-related sulfurtransferase
VERGVCGVDAILAEARSTLVRLSPDMAARAQREGALLVDIRPSEQRHADGTIPGALIIDRNVLEWRLDPECPTRIAEMTDRNQVVVIICAEGYSSSLAAATLQRLGLARATDLDGGFIAWRHAGLPVIRGS